MYPHLLDEVKKIHPEWQRSLTKNTLLVVALLLERQTVNLWKLKGSVGKLLGNTQTDCRSHYQRLKRWLRAGESDKGLWVNLLRASVSLLQKRAVCLILDGSSWKWGGKTYHFLTLSLLYQGVSVPVWWLELGRLGISSQWHRKLLLRLALRVLDLRGKALLADREYIGQEWFETLRQAGIDPVIRLRKSNYQEQVEQAGRPLAKLESKARSRVGRVVWQDFWLEGGAYRYVLVAYRDRSGKVELLRLVTTLSPAKAVEHYGHRYRIESMFRHLKSNGFDLESLHVQKPYKVQLMMAALVLAYTLSVVYGLKRYRRAVKPKKHGHPEMSVFRWGLDLWQNHLQSFALFLRQLQTYFQLWLRPEKSLLNRNVP
jgi:hypothetical protein